MKRSILLLLVATLISCKGKNKTTKTSEPSLPSFITQKIEGYKKENDPKHWPVITQYSYKGSLVYYFKMPCCDQQNVLYDAQGNELCKPDGGFTGNGDGKCSDFNASKTDPKSIWPLPKED